MTMGRRNFHPFTAIRSHRPEPRLIKVRDTCAIVDWDAAAAVGGVAVCLGWGQ